MTSRKLFLNKEMGTSFFLMKKLSLMTGAAAAILGYNVDSVDKGARATEDDSLVPGNHATPGFRFIYTR